MPAGGARDTVPLSPGIQQFIASAMDTGGDVHRNTEIGFQLLLPARTTHFMTTCVECGHSRVIGAVRRALRNPWMRRVQDIDARGSVSFEYNPARRAIVATFTADFGNEALAEMARQAWMQGGDIDIPVLQEGQAFDDPTSVGEQPAYPSGSLLGEIMAALDELG